MTISELIERLVEIRRAEGEIEVELYPYGPGRALMIGPPLLIDEVTVEPVTVHSSLLTTREKIRARFPSNQGERPESAGGAEQSPGRQSISKWEPFLSTSPKPNCNAKDLQKLAMLEDLQNPRLKVADGKSAEAGK